MGTFPSDFNIPLDEGGQGQGRPMGGFGGDPAKSQTEHRATLKRLAKAPVILIHGNAGVADSGDWDMLDLKDMLLATGYAPELIWAPSYLGPGGIVEQEPHVQNISEVRHFIENVCAYLNVRVVDIIAHSLGCSLAYATFRGLEKKQPGPPYSWNEPQKWQRVGTFVALAAAFHGLGPFSSGEWRSDGEFLRELLDERGGGGGETPYAKGKPKTQDPAHNIVYFCGVARGDFIDAQNQDTGKLNGAVNKAYNLGASTIGHRKIKESRSVFEDFRPLLNSVPPRPPIVVTVDKESGQYAGPLQIMVNIEPTGNPVLVKASRVVKEMKNGILTASVLDQVETQLNNGQSITLQNNGLWELSCHLEGTEMIRKTYWVGIEAIKVEIPTDNATPFDGSLEVLATATRGNIYHSLNGQMWTLGANVNITEDAVVYFVAIDAEGIASDVVSKPFKKAIIPDEFVTANAIDHFIAGRIEVSEYLSYSQQFGFFTPFTLYLVAGDWVLDPNAPRESVHAPIPEVAIRKSDNRHPLVVQLSAHDLIDASPKIYYTLDGSRPTVNSPFLIGSGQIALKTPGSQTIKYFVQNAFGRSTEINTQEVNVTTKGLPVIRVKKGYPQPGSYTEAVTTLIEAVGPKGEALEVHYSTDGTFPGKKSTVFTKSREFTFTSRGNHAISCCTMDPAGNRHIEVFHYSIDDQQYPETCIAPSRGGRYAGSVQVVLTPDKPVAWTKYTLDGTAPDADNGLLCKEPIQLKSNTVLKWRSRDMEGNLEPVHSAVFEVTQEKEIAVFDNNRRKNGSIKSSADGRRKMIGTFKNLTVGIDQDGNVNHAILHFDTAGLPDNASIRRAYLQIRCAELPKERETGRMVVDVQSGYFGSSLELQADDWDAPASAGAIAVIDHLESETLVSSDFKAAGLNAINKTGTTQMRLRFEPARPGVSQCIRLRPGADAKLFIEYQV